MKFNPHDSNWLLNKFDFYKELRNQEKAYWSEEYKSYIITRYHDVLFSLSSPEIFYSGKGNLVVESPHRFGNTLGASDNKRHDFLKNVVKNAYSKNNISRIVSIMSEKTKDLLKEKTTVNISSVIEEISGWVTAEILNLPYDKEEIKNLIVDVQKHASQAVKYDVDNTSYNKLREIFINLSTIERPLAPGPGIYQEYILNMPRSERIMSLFAGPCISGASSLTGSLEFLILDLYRENQIDYLMNDRNLIENAVLESLRFNASTGRFSRTVKEEIKLHGVILKPEDRVILCLDSANRDPSKFENPDIFDIYRNTKGSLAFGHGVHSCIALAISKACMIEFLNLVLDHFGHYKVLTKNSELKYLIPASGNNDMISEIMIQKI